jgi:hypothetical protein
VHEPLPRGEATQIVDKQSLFTSIPLSIGVGPRSNSAGLGSLQRYLRDGALLRVRRL